ncbi:tetratricopeptide repeat protein [Streptomyces anulatus]|uniref:tetratricopeptide repeat protein n=1 Tax=Streptomyces anulatus TaxID=1892 RepID=UPI0033EC878B
MLSPAPSATQEQRPKNSSCADTSWTPRPVSWASTTPTSSAAATTSPALSFLGEYQQAVELHRQTLTGYERVLGPDHPHTLNSRNGLANTLNGLGEYQQAVELHRRNLTGYEHVLGPDHPHTLNSRSNLAIARARLAEVGRRRWWQLPRRR